MAKRITLKNPHQEIRLFNRRIVSVSIIIVFLSFLLLVRLYYLQNIRHGLYSTLSRQNQLDIVPIPPNRGLIYDRHGVLLAKNIPVINLEIVPEHVRNMDATITSLQKIIEISDDDVKQFKTLLQQHRRFESIPIKINLTEEEVAKFAVNEYHFAGVSARSSRYLIRDYQLGNVMNDVLGYVGRVNEEELATLDPTNYSATHFIGKLGIEKYYEVQLHGIAGYEQVETDATGRIVRVIKKTPPIAGDNLYLTIDSSLQAVAKLAIGDRQGAVVAIDPNNGHILALASTPSYDPNLFVQGISNKQFKALRDAPNRPLYNRALRGLYPPASTIKPMLALEGLEHNIITPNTRRYDPGYYELTDNNHQFIRKFRDWKHEGHGWVTIKEAIASSCDTYYYHLAKLMGIDHIYDVLTSFGFGQRTGLDIGEELPGLVPSADWKFKNRHERWFPGDTLVAGIGQGFMQATPLQLATATAIIANRGQRMRPTLLLKSHLPDNTDIIQPTIELEPIKFKPHTWDIVIDGMHRVTSAPYGTAYYAFKSASYSVAAKTGTAQVVKIDHENKKSDDTIPEHLRDHALFIGYAPVDNPKIAIAVIIEHSRAASLVARKLFDHYLLKKKIQA